MKRYLLLALAAVVLSSACVRSEDVTFTGLGGVDMRGSKVTLDLGIENRSGHKLHLLACDLKVEYRGAEALAAKLAAPVTVGRHFAGQVPVELNLLIKNPLAGMAAMAGLRNSPDAALVSGEVVVRAGMARKKITYDREPLSRILSTFAIAY